MMKKIKNLVLAVIFPLILAGCGLSQNQLIEDNWSMTTNFSDTELTFDADFDESNMVLAIQDTGYEEDSMAGTVLEAVLNQTDLTWAYTLEDEQITLTNDDMDFNATYELTKVEGEDAYTLTEVSATDSETTTLFNNATLTKVVEEESSSASE